MQKLFLAIALSWTFAASAEPTDAISMVLSRSTAALTELSLNPVKDRLADKCVTDLIHKKHHQKDLVEKIEQPRLRTAFLNVCALAYSGNDGYKLAIFLINPLTNAAKNAGNKILMRAADDIPEVAKPL